MDLPSDASAPAATPEVAVAVPVVAAPEKVSWRRKVLTFPLALFVFSRIAYLGMSFMGMELVPTLFMHDYGRNPFMQKYPALDGLCRWDCGWFVRVVQEGYSDLQHAAVCPLFPAIGWAVERYTGLHHVFVFLILANGASLASYYVVYQLFREVDGDDAARWGLLLFAAYPFAYYQAAGYAESTVVLTTAGAMLLARRKHWFWAGIVLGIGILGRQLALLGGAGMLAIYIRQRGLNWKKLLLDPSLFGLVIPWLFIGGFAWYLSVVLGDPLAFLKGRNVGWNEWVWYSVRQILMYVPYAERPEYFYYVAFVTVPTLGAAMLCFRKRYFELAACGVAMMAVTVSIGCVALGRYSATAWPCYLPMGLWLSRRPAFAGPVIAMFMLFQGFFFFLFSHQFRIL